MSDSRTLRPMTVDQTHLNWYFIRHPRRVESFKEQLELFQKDRNISQDIRHSIESWRYDYRKEGEKKVVV